MAVGVDEASRAYERAMRNIAATGPGVCPICRTFISPDHKTCFPCGHQPASLAAVAPITYSENLGQMHLALRNYKDGGSPAVRRYAAIRLAAILWRFLDEHEACVAGSAGVDEFDLVTAVPSSSPQRDRRSPFRQLVGWIRPIHSRTKRLLAPTGAASGERDFDPQRFRAVDELSGESVLLLDDTWTTGSSARSASHVLLEAGASNVALVVIGRHLRPEYEPVEDSGETCRTLFRALPEAFDWDTCAVHE
jgi:predicted amidophosphoribosyltransferase